MTKLTAASKGFDVKRDGIELGGHDWGVWKNDLFLLTQRLFRE